jgi:hypothetical protein
MICASTASSCHVSGWTSQITGTSPALTIACALATYVTAGTSTPQPCGRFIARSASSSDSVPFATTVHGAFVPGRDLRFEAAHERPAVDVHLALVDLAQERKEFVRRRHRRDQDADHANTATRRCRRRYGSG